MSVIFQKIKAYSALILKHKIISVLAILAIGGSGYYGYRTFFTNDGAVRYAFARVEEGTLVVSISGSGQVSASNQVDVKPKISGEIASVYAAPGQEVAAGRLIAQLDASDAQRLVRDAETALETARLELAKTLEPADELTLLQSENALAQAKESKQKAEDNIKKAYEDGFNNIANAFLALPEVMTGLQNILYGTSRELGGNGQWNIDYYAGVAGQYNDSAVQLKQDVYGRYQAARKAYDENFVDYKTASRFSDQTIIEPLITQTYETARLISEAVKSSSNLLQLYQDELAKRNLSPVALSNTHLSSLNSYTGIVNGNLSNLLSIQRSIRDSQEAVVSAERAIKERELSLAKTKSSANDLDIRSKKIAVREREDALATARQALADTSLRAPFAGVVAKISAKIGDNASSGAAVATLITKQKIAEVSLNEIDAAKAKPGQKATLTFDAIPDLTIAGQVAEVDTLGSVSQGVVTYAVKIGFGPVRDSPPKSPSGAQSAGAISNGVDTQYERIKSGMSVTAAIIIEAKPDVLLVPNSAVKSQGSMSYVELPSAADASLAAAASAVGTVLGFPLERREVEAGASNDEFTEIVSGLNAGDQVVSRAIQPTASQTKNAQSSSLRIPGVTGGGGAGFRGGGLMR